MQTNVPEQAARAAFGGLIDYAGLFPPAQLAMRPAVEEYVAARGGAHAWMLGRFIVPVSRAGELLEAAGDGEPLPLSAILDGGLPSLDVARALRGESRVTVEALEVVLEPAQVDAFAEAAAEARLTELPAFVEFPRGAAWAQSLDEGMQTLARLGLGAKVRCGGLTAGAFPSPGDLAAFLLAAARERVPFKATAGLHHPMRHYNEPSGFTMHGFLNVLAAAALAWLGADAAAVEACLACEDAAQFRLEEHGLAFGERQIATADLLRVRREFLTGYGSCSFSEPIDDLRAMGMLA